MVSKRTPFDVVRRTVTRFITDCSTSGLFQTVTTHVERVRTHIHTAIDRSLAWVVSEAKDGEPLNPPEQLASRARRPGCPP